MIYSLLLRNKWEGSAPESCKSTRFCTLAISSSSELAEQLEMYSQLSKCSAGDIKGGGSVANAKGSRHCVVSTEFSVT